LLFSAVVLLFLLTRSSDRLEPEVEKEAQATEELVAFLKKKVGKKKTKLVVLLIHKALTQS